MWPPPPPTLCEAEIVVAARKGYVWGVRCGGAETPHPSLRCGGLGSAVGSLMWFYDGDAGSEEGGNS